MNKYSSILLCAFALSLASQTTQAAFEQPKQVKFEFLKKAKIATKTGIAKFGQTINDAFEATPQKYNLLVILQQYLHNILARLEGMEEVEIVAPLSAEESRILTALRIEIQLKDRQYSKALLKLCEDVLIEAREDANVDPTNAESIVIDLHNFISNKINARKGLSTTAKNIAHTLLVKPTTYCLKTTVVLGALSGVTYGLLRATGFSSDTAAAYAMRPLKFAVKLAKIPLKLLWSIISDPISSVLKNLTLGIKLKTLCTKECRKKLVALCTQTCIDKAYPKIKILTAKAIREIENTCAKNCITVTEK